MKEILKTIGIVLAIVASIVGICLLCVLHEEKEDERKWNNGHCSICEIGHYELFDITAGRGLNKDTYFYLCDNCSNVIKLHGRK